MNVHDPFGLDGSGVRAAFDRAGPTYEAAAVLQARVGEELFERLELFDFNPALILDLGAGTGRFSGRLKRRYRRSRVIALDLAPGMLREAARHQRWLRRFDRVCADAAQLPLSSASADVVFSNLMLQWCAPPDGAFAEVRRVLKPQGFFTFSTLGPDTLMELRDAWGEVDARTHVNRFLDMHDVGDALMRAGFTEPVLDVERLTVTYVDVGSLMRDLKSIGARNMTAGRWRALTGKGRLQRVIERYEAYRRDGRLPATYEVIYGAAWASRDSAERPNGVQAAGTLPPAMASRAGNGPSTTEVLIPPARIRRRERT
jgi:malonyl-CoA O-methyltransferase